MATKVRHPLFARSYARVGKAAEAKGAAEHRDACLAGFEITHIRRFHFASDLLSTHAAPTILGVARRP